MKNNHKTVYQKFVGLLASRAAFVIIMAIAGLQCGWMAISSRYPMAFDESYHYNLIRIHSEQWNPLFLRQPEGPAPYGALVRDPSLLYHWILSIPYKILDALGASEFTKVVILRFGSVLMFLLGLYLFRRLLLHTKASRAAIHTTLLLFVSVPTVITLAGQLNYDNLQFPLVAATLIATHAAATSLRAKKPDALLICRALALSLLGCLNKFTFLPVITAVALYLLVVWLRAYGSNFNKFRVSFMRSWNHIAIWHRPAVLGVTWILAGLFIWFYGVNTIMYRNPVIQCHQVLEPARCEDFEPWLRNHTLAKEAVRPPANPFKFSVDWIGGMYIRTFFVINGASGPSRYHNSLPVGIAGTAVLLLCVGIPLLARHGHRILRGDPMLQLGMVITLIYVVSLWGRNFNDFLHLGQMVAINGRYFQPVLIFLILMFVAAFQHAFRFVPAIKLLVFVATMIGFASGGGIIAFLHYSDPNWYFEAKPWLVSWNEVFHKLVSPLFLFK